MMMNNPTHASNEMHTELPFGSLEALIERSRDIIASSRLVSESVRVGDPLSMSAFHRSRQ